MTGAVAIAIAFLLALLSQRFVAMDGSLFRDINASRNLQERQQMGRLGQGPDATIV
jgi:hypothetical protein